MFYTSKGRVSGINPGHNPVRKREHCVDRDVCAFLYAGCYALYITLSHTGRLFSYRLHNRTTLQVLKMTQQVISRCNLCCKKWSGSCLMRNHFLKQCWLHKFYWDVMNDQSQPHLLKFFQWFRYLDVFIQLYGTSKEYYMGFRVLGEHENYYVLLRQKYCFGWCRLVLPYESAMFDFSSVSYISSQVRFTLGLCCFLVPCHFSSGVKKVLCNNNCVF